MQITPMIRRLVFPLALLAIIASCNKDKFKTEPQVNVKSISPNTVFSGDILTVKGEYTDDEGDIDSVFIVYKWYNGNAVVIPSTGDTFRIPFRLLNVPPKTRQADILVEFEFNSNRYDDIADLPGVSKDTTATFGLILKDKAGHRSNYSESEKIRLKK